jgi:hypothetical protein
MLRATFLGHHSWLIEAQGNRLLIDPLLRERFGHSHAAELRVHPPKRLSPSGFPAVDAVFLTHEHEGHFDIGSLARIDRRVPIYFPARSSHAMATILGELGFTTRAVEPGRSTSIGALELLPMAADQVRDAVIEEWDSLAYLVWERGTANSLFANVDMPVTERMWRAAKRVVPRPALWGHTDNHYSPHYMHSWGRPDLRALQRSVTSVLAVHERLRREWAAPGTLLMLGGGFGFGGERSWLNREAFPFDNEKIAAALSTLLPRERAVCPVPGQALEVEDGRLTRMVDLDGFVQPAPRESWPSHAFAGQLEWLGEISPGSGRAALAADELAALDDELARFAGHLYGSREFRGVCSLSDEELGGRRPTFALLLRADTDGSAYVYEYDSSRCRFVPSESTDPVKDYAAVFECWATDLLATLRCEISATVITFARHRVWNALPARLPFDLNRALFEYVHPLRQPERCLALYRRVVAEQVEAGERPLVPFAGA